MEKGKNEIYRLCYISIIDKNKKLKNSINQNQYGINIIIIVILFVILFIILNSIFSKTKYNQQFNKENNECNRKKKIACCQDKKENFFNEEIKQKYKFQQNFFCQNEDIFYNSLIESRIKFVNTKIVDMSFDIFIYKKNDIVSNFIAHKGNYESKEIKSILSSLLFYSKKKFISINNNYILDIGANIGMHTFT